MSEAAAGTIIGGGRILRLFAAMAVATLLVACSATFTNHGFVPPEPELAQVELGDTREAVAEKIGRPATSGVLRDEAWVYTAYRVRNYAYQSPQVIEREVVAVSFDGSGRVSNVERFGLEAGRVVELSRRVTETSVRDLGFFRQLLRNLGRVDLTELGS